MQPRTCGYASRQQWRAAFSYLHQQWPTWIRCCASVVTYSSAAVTLPLPPPVRDTRLGVPAPSPEAIHGSLLALAELLQHTGEFLLARWVVFRRTGTSQDRDRNVTWVYMSVSTGSAS
jgi:hypothetical protein